MKRAFDFLFALLLMVLLTPMFFVIHLLILMTSKGSAIYWSKRIGVNNEIFLMPKYRSMYLHAPQIATHLLRNPAQYITPIGKILRKTSLDELPQLYSILKGDMSFVGPRPALFNQEDLISLRTKFGLEKLRPGLTGWAQINGRDDIEIPKKVELDLEYAKSQGFFFDLKILLLTVIKVVKGSGVNH